MPRFTHTATIRGNDARTPAGAKAKIKVRETKCYWISEHGIKYRKPTGHGVGDWPMFDLDIKTLSPIVEA